MPTAGPIKFRCYRCNKLLGVSRSKAGATVACPQCEADLIVPEPEGVDPAPEAEAAAPSGPSGSRIEPSVVPWDRLVPEEAPPPEEPAFPAIRVEPLSLRPEPPIRLKPPASPPPPPPRPEPPGPAPALGPAIVPGLAIEPPSIRDEPGPRAAVPSVRESPPRRSDVSVPRTAMILWSFLALVAIVLAFATGLLLGRFVWAPSAPARPAAPASASAPGGGPAARLADGFVATADKPIASVLAVKYKK